MAWFPERERHEGPRLGGAMTDTISSEVVVGMKQGLHARPADMLAREARKWQARVELLCRSQRVDGKSILDILTLAAEEGTRIVVEVTGPDAREALAAIVRLFETRFNESEETVADAVGRAAGP